MENCSCVFDLAKEKTDFEQKKKKLAKTKVYCML